MSTQPPTASGQHLLIFGRQPELSMAELVACQEAGGYTITPVQRSAAVIEGLAGDPQPWFRTLGGAVKMGERVGEIPNVEALRSAETIALLQRHVAPANKQIFGFSAYGLDGTASFAAELPGLATQLKKALRDEGQGSRYIRGEKGVLSSVVVAKQRLLDRGAEFLLVETGSAILVGRTVTVQAFEEFAGRDYGRPGRNPRSGMLPPKLARILLHLGRGKPDDVVLDPFCGSGTLLQEALLLGYQTVHGSDASHRAALESEQNVSWMKGANPSVTGTASVHEADVRSLLDGLGPASIDRIVTEPFLGPPLTGHESPEKIASVVENLTLLYKEAFTVFAKLLRPNGAVVFLLPVYFLEPEPRFLPLLDDLLAAGFKLRDPLPPTMVPLYQRDLTSRGTLLYRRPQQRVGREILILEKS